MGWSSWEMRLVMDCFALSYPKRCLKKGVSPIRAHTHTLKHIEGKWEGQGLPSAFLRDESFTISALSHLLNYCSLPHSSFFQTRLHTSTSVSKGLTVCLLPQISPDWWLSLQPSILPPHKHPSHPQCPNTVFSALFCLSAPTLPGHLQEYGLPCTALFRPNGALM